MNHPHYRHSNDSAARIELRIAQPFTMLQPQEEEVHCLQHNHIHFLHAGQSS